MTSTLLDCYESGTFSQHDLTIGKVIAAKPVRITTGNDVREYQRDHGGAVTETHMAWVVMFSSSDQYVVAVNDCDGGEIDNTLFQHFDDALYYFNNWTRP